MKTILILFLFLCSVLTDGTIQSTIVNFTSPCQPNESNQLTRVEKLVDVRYDFTLVPNRPWTQFPDMAIEF